MVTPKRPTTRRGPLRKLSSMLSISSPAGWRSCAASRRSARRCLAAGDSAARPAEPPVIVCPYDAELFGHWWYEGHQWLEAVLRGLAARSDESVVVDTTTLGGYAAAHAPTTEAALPVSSWGRGGYAEVWLQPRSQWVTSAAARGGGSHGAGCAKAPRPAALRAAAACAEPSRAGADARAKQRLDVHSRCGTVTTYAAKRIETHLSHFHELLNRLETGLLRQRAFRHSCIPWSGRSPFLPELHYRLFHTTLPSTSMHRSPSSIAKAIPLSSSVTSLQCSTDSHHQLRILMLAWEYPPHVIGGLARAVCDLSRQLASIAVIPFMSSHVKLRIVFPMRRVRGGPYSSCRGSPVYDGLPSFP